MEPWLQPIAAFLEQTPWLPTAGALAGAALVLFAGGFAAGFGLARSGRGRAREGFAALAAEALRHNAEDFLALASERFRRLEDSAEAWFKADWDVRHRTLEQTVGPLREALERYRAEALELERTRSTAVGAVGEQLRALSEETARLSGALRGTPAARGRWGELTLRRTAELAGLSEHCDFAEQAALARAAARPDMIVRLPGGRELAVDAKTPLDAYLEAAEAAGDAARAASLERHAKNVRRHVDTLAGRDYAARLERTPTFVVLFLPDEGFLAAAVARDRALVEHALAKGVVIATPATLYALLGAVAQGWREARLAEGTLQILGHARELDERLGLFLEHLGRVGSALGRSVEAFNAAVGSLESRVLPQARRMRELGVEGRRAIDAPEPVTAAPRAASGATPPADPRGIDADALP